MFLLVLKINGLLSAFLQVKFSFIFIFWTACVPSCKWANSQLSCCLSLFLLSVFHVSIVYKEMMQYLRAGEYVEWEQVSHFRKSKESLLVIVFMVVVNVERQFWSIQKASCSKRSFEFKRYTRITIINDYDKFVIWPGRVPKLPIFSCVSYPNLDCYKSFESSYSPTASVVFRLFLLFHYLLC